MADLPQNIVSKAYKSLLHMCLRFIYTSIASTGIFSTKFGMYAYGHAYNTF